MITRDVNSGMSLDEVMMYGEDPSLYKSLTSNTISTTAERVTKVNELLADLALITETDPQSESKKEEIISQITTICNDETTALETSVETDLIAQETLRNASTVNDTISTVAPFNAPSKLFDLVATDKLKQLAEKVSEIRTKDN